MPAPATCPNCGADVPKGAKACPECGADEQTGWSEESYASGLGISEDSFDYEKFVEEEFPSGRKPIPRGIHWFWWLVAIIVAAALLIALVRR